MGFFDGLKVRAAILNQQKGETAQAKAAYEELYAKGKVQCVYMLPWSILLLREGGEDNFRKVKEILAKAQKASDINEERRGQIILNFAVAEWKLGNAEKAVELLERLHQKKHSGDTYGALGYLYVELGDAEKALAFNQSALEYDDEDAVALDNMGQTYYRLLNDKEKALPYFQKAHEIKPTQIDTLWFLSRYDIDAGNTAAAVEKLEKAVEGRFSPLNMKTREEVASELTRLRG